MKVASRLLLPALVVLAASACSSIEPVKITVHSDPPGGYVVMQEKGGDWIYLGNTPLVVVRQMDLDAVESSSGVLFKVMKEGYFEQSKQWGGPPFIKENDQKGGIFWNPRLVPSR